MNKNMLILGLGRAVQMVAMFASYRLLSAFFSAADMSSYYFLLSISGMFGLLVANPIGMYLNRIIHLARSNQSLNSTIRFFLFVFTLTSLIVVPIVLLSKDKLSDSEVSISTVAMILVVYVIGAATSGFLISALNILSKNLQFVFLISLSAIVGLGFSVGAIHIIQKTPELWLLGQGVATVLFGLVAVMLIKQAYPSDSKPFSINKNEFFKFSTPILVTNIFVWIMSQSFRFFLKGNVDDSLLGEIGFGLGVATALAVAVEYLFQQLLFPSFYSKLDSGDKSREESWNDLFSKSAPAFLCLTVYMALLSPFLMTILADPKFKNAYIFFALGAAIELFRMLGNMVNMAFHSEMKTHRSIQSYLLGGLVTIVGVIWISYNEKYLTLTPYVLILGQLIIFISLFFNLRKIIKIKNCSKSILKYAFLSTPFLLVLLFDIGANLLTSVSICFIFGLYLLFLFHKIQKESNG